MRSIILYAVLAASAAMITACSTSDTVAPTIAPASAELALAADVGTTAWRPVDEFVWVSCANGGAGETVHVTGDLRYAMHRNQDSSGIVHLNIKSNTSGLTGVGVESGASFRGTMAERVNSRAEDELNMDLRTADVVRFVGKGGADAYSLTVTSRLILDQGTYVVAEQTWKEGCR